MSTYKNTCTWSIFKKKSFINLALELNNSFYLQNLSVNSKNFDLFSKQFLLTLNTNFTLLLFSFKNITLYNDVLIKTSRIGVFSKEINVLNNATINASGMGCLSDEGPGKGTGGSYGGYRGYGLGINMKESKLCKFYSWKLDINLKNLPYGNSENPLFEGSGGGSDNQDKFAKVGGSGGGIIYMSALETINLDGKLLSNGNGSFYKCQKVTGSGAGAGGSIQIHSKFLKGKGLIQAKGGDSFDKCGEGGGGRVKIGFHAWNNSKIIGNQWEGKIDVSPGNRYMTINVLIRNFRGTKGTIMTDPCLAGFFPKPLCSPCPTGTYKDSIGSGSCKKCLNVPYYGTLDQVTGWTNKYCPYNCKGIILKYHSGKIIRCLSYYEAYYEILKNYFGFFVFLIVVGSLIIGFLYQTYFKMKTMKDDDIGFLTYFESQNESFSQNNFTLPDLLFHAHRIQVHGTNRFDNRWFLKKDPPEEIEYLVSTNNYCTFAISFNEISKWSRSLGIFLRIMSLLNYPTYLLIMHLIRINKYKKLARFVETKCDFWKYQNTELMHIKLKLYSSPDYSQAFLDIFNYKYGDTKYFTLSCPFTINLGSFSKPFYIDRNDPFYRSLLISINKKTQTKILNSQLQNLSLIGELASTSRKSIEIKMKLKYFYQRLNKLTCLIDFASTTEKFVNHVFLFSEFIKKWNAQIFNDFGIQIDLIVSQITRERYGHHINSITLVETLTGSNFKKFFSECNYLIKIHNLVHITKTLYSVYDIKFGLFIYDLESDLVEMENRRISFMIMSFISEDEDKSERISEDIFQVRDKFVSKYEKHNRPYKRHSNTSEESIIFDSKSRSTSIKPLKFMKRVVHYFRYLFFSHKIIKNLSKGTTYILISILILIDTIITLVLLLNLKFNYHDAIIEIFVPFPLAPFLTIIFGCVWISSQSYVIGKLFVVFNYMSILNLIINLFINTAKYWNFYVFFLKVISILLKIGICQIGCLWLRFIINNQY